MDQKTTYSYQRTPGLDCPKCGVYFPTTIPDLLSGRGTKGVLEADCTPRRGDGEGGRPPAARYRNP